MSILNEIEQRLRSKLPKVVYHGTTTEAWKEMRQGDLVFHVTTNLKDAEAYATQRLQSDSEEYPIGDVDFEIPSPIVYSVDPRKFKNVTFGIDYAWGERHGIDSGTWEDSLRDDEAFTIIGDIDKQKHLFKVVKVLDIPEDVLEKLELDEAADHAGDSIRKTAEDVRNRMPDQKCSRGQCVDWNRALQKELSQMGIETEVMQGWVQLDGQYSQTARSFEDIEWADTSDSPDYFFEEEHIWLMHGDTAIDITADQFNDRIKGDQFPRALVAPLKTIERFHQFD